MEATRSPPLSTAAAPPRQRPAPSSAGASVLRSLQAENDSLRSDVLRERQRSAQLQQELTDVRVAAEQVVRESAASTAEQMRALQERCRLLADRLVAKKREEQLAETARVGFVLRSQLEERRFLKRALEEMQQALAAPSSPSAQPDRASSARGGAEVAQAREEVHTGELYRLMMSVSDALHTYMAAAKLEKARTRLAFERATAVVDELRCAMGDATRTAFDAAVLAGHMEDDTAAAGVGVAAPAGDVFEPSSFLVLPRDSTRGGSLAVPATPPPPSSTHAWVAPSPAGQLAVELEWVCDILKACVRGAAEAHTLLGTAAEGLKAPPLHLASSQQEDQLASVAFPATTGASAEMSALLRSFFRDLCALKRHAAQQQESMARQLAHEVEQHFHSTQQSAQRIQLLEAECARLLRHAEREARVTPARDATTQTPKRLKAGVPVRPRPVAEPPVTPERYTAPHVSSEAATPFSPAQESRAARSKPPAAPADALAPAAAAVRASLPPTSAVAPTAEAGHATRALFSNYQDPPHTRALTPPRDAAQRAVRDPVARHPVTASAAAGASLRTSRNSSFHHAAAEGEPSLTVSPQRKSSAAAIALWASYRARDEQAARRPSPTALLSPPRTSSQHLLSPPPAPPPAYRTAYTAAAHHPTATASGSSATRAAASHSPQRRSATVSAPPRRPAATTTTAPAPAAVRCSLSVATLSSVSTSSDQLSPPPRQRPGTEGLVASHPRSPPPSAARMVSSELAPPPPSSQEPPSIPPPRASTPPPAEASTRAVTAAVGAGPHRRRLSQQLYDEAAADVFSSTSSSGSAIPHDADSSVRRHRPGAPRASDAGVKTPSPRRPVRLNSRVADTSPGGGQGPLRSPMRSSTGLSTPLRSTSGGLGVEGRAEPRSTPHIWRRIQAEVSWQQQQQQHTLPSPIVGGEPSALFGTPREVPWADS